jgi:hypothetical protein
MFSIPYFYRDLGRRAKTLFDKRMNFPGKVVQASMAGQSPRFAQVLACALACKLLGTNLIFLRKPFLFS